MGQKEITMARDMRVGQKDGEGDTNESERYHYGKGYTSGTERCHYGDGSPWRCNRKTMDRILLRRGDTNGIDD